MARKLSRRSVAAYIATQLSTGAAVKPLALQLAGYLLDTKRTKELDLILRDVQACLAEMGYVTARVSTAHELSAATLKEVEAFTKQQTGAKQIILERSVDATLLGGIKLETPGRELDDTIARKLTLLRTRYKKA